MKISNALFLAACVLVGLSGYAQKISIKEKEARIEKVFKEIRKQTGYQFLYTTKMVENAKRVTINLKDATLDEVLNQCFHEQPFTYEIKEKTIIVKSKSNGSDPDNKSDPPKDIQGRLTDEKGDPIAGATIHVNGTALTASTNPDGAFSLKGVDADAILKISHIQYDDVIISLKGKSMVNAVMQTRVSSMDELQVIGYGTVTRRLNTGNVFTIKAKDIEKQPVNNPLQAMQGRVPGLTIVQETGVPGGSYNVLIRGRNSLINGNDPLYIIDGVPYNSQIIPNLLTGSIASVNSIGINKVPSPLNYINVNDIESIEVLKDADATAIYGSRGANGVILITTKKGNTGKTAVNLNVQTGISQVAHTVKMLNTEQYLEYRNEAFENDGLTPGMFDVDLNGTWDKSRYTDWQNVLIGKNAGYTDAQASVSGGNTDIQYLINAGYHNEQAVFPGDFGLKKGSIHAAINTTSQNKKLKVQLKASYVTSLNRLADIDMMSETAMYPLAPEMFDVNGNLNWQNNSWTNPYSHFLSYSKANTKTLLGNGVIGYELLPGLEIKTSAGYTELQFNDIAVSPTTAFRPNRNILTGKSNFSYNTNRAWTVEPQLEYKLTFSGARIDALVGATLQENRSSGMQIGGIGYNDNSLLESLASATTISKGKVYDQVYRYNSGFGRIRFNWQDKYIVHVTGRRDGSSRFGPENRFANFGSAGAAWLFSNENFVINTLPLLSYGKIRMSYGITGNDQIGDYRYLDLYNYLSGNGYNVPYQGSSALFPGNLYTPNLAWEENKKMEAGLEIGLAKDRFFFSASYFRNRSSNQLVNQPLPDITGFSGVTINLPALVQNAGWEFIAKTHNINTKNVSWVSSINFTKQANKLIDFPGLAKSTYARSLVIGQPITVQQVYHNIGVDEATGLYSFLDAKGNPTSLPGADIADQYILVNIDPKFTGGFQNTITWRNIEIDFFLQYVKQVGRNPLLLNSVSPGIFDQFTSFNWPVEIMNNRWQKQGDIATIQKFSTQFEALDAYSAAVLSDFGWVDASFLRLKNASVSYRLPEAWVKKMHLQNVRLYVQGQNIFTITPYKGIDPENAPVGVAFPPLRVLTGGIQVNL